MKLSKKALGAKKSITMEVNEKFRAMVNEGKSVYNLCSGQLRFRPTPDFVQSMISQMNYLASFQYPSVQGNQKLRKKIIDHYSNKRNLSFEDSGFEVIVSNGSKHSLYNALGAILDPDDEVILLCPYWVSYPEMIQFWGAKPVIVDTYLYDSFSPSISRIEEAITDNTKAIIINSPNNPGGIFYNNDWMKIFSEMISKYDDIYIVSDEIYDDIYYYDPGPTYFYEKKPSLLNRTIITNGISKSFSATGLRLGYCLAQKEVVDAMTRIQSQTTSGTNSLIQRSVADFNFDHLKDFHSEIKQNLRELSTGLREEFRKANLSHCWYQTNSAFYFMLDFSRTELYNKVSEGKEGDFSNEICELILEKTSVALVPGSSFGLKNSARLSLVLERIPFNKALSRLCEYLNNPT